MDSINNAANVIGQDTQAAPQAPSTAMSDQDLGVLMSGGVTQPSTPAPMASKEMSAGDLATLMQPSNPLAPQKQKPTPNPFVANISRKDKLALLAQHISPGVNMAGLTDQAVDASYALTQQALQNNLKPLFTSGAGGAGHVPGSLHGSGLAVDMRLFDKEGKDLDPHEEAKAVAAIAHQTGWAGMLDEVNHPIPGVTHGPNIHLSVGRRDGAGMALNDPKQNFFSKLVNPALQTTTPAAAILQRAQDFGNTGIQGTARSIAISQGLDPNVFHALVNQESGFNPKAQSPVGAFGLTQLMPGTNDALAKRYGYNPANTHNNPTQQLQLGAHYVQEMLQQFGGNYARALAGYNAGPGGVQKMIESGHVYKETGDYVFKIMHQIDPTIKTLADAQNAILGGTGMVSGGKNPADIQDQQNRIARSTASYLDTLKSAHDNVAKLPDNQQKLHDSIQDYYSKNTHNDGSWMGAAADTVRQTFDPHNPLSIYNHVIHQVYNMADGLLMNALPDDQTMNSMNAENNSIMSNYGFLNKNFVKAGQLLPYMAASVYSFDKVSRAFSLLGNMGRLGEFGGGLSSVMGEGESAVSSAAKYLLGKGPNTGFQSTANIAMSSFFDGAARHYMGWLGNQASGAANQLSGTNWFDPNNEDTHTSQAHAFMGAMASGLFNMMAGTTMHLWSPNALGQMLGVVQQSVGKDGIADGLAQFLTNPANPIQRGIFGAASGAVGGSLTAQIANGLGYDDVSPGTAFMLGGALGGGLGVGASPLLRKSGMDKVLQGVIERMGPAVDNFAAKWGEKIPSLIQPHVENFLSYGQTLRDQTVRNGTEYLNKALVPEIAAKEKILNETLLPQLQQMQQAQTQAQQALEGATSQIKQMAESHGSPVGDYVKSQSALEQARQALGQVDPKNKGQYESTKGLVDQLTDKIAKYEKLPQIGEFNAATVRQGQAQQALTQAQQTFGTKGQDLQNLVEGHQNFLGLLKETQQHVDGVLNNPDLWDQWKKGDYQLPNPVFKPTVNYVAPLNEADQDLFKANVTADMQKHYRDFVQRVTQGEGPADIVQYMGRTYSKSLAVAGAKESYDESLTQMLPELEKDFERARKMPQATRQSVQSSDIASFYDNSDSWERPEGVKTALLDAEAITHRFLQENPGTDLATLKSWSAGYQGSNLKNTGDVLPLPRVEPGASTVSQELATAAQAALDQGESHVPVKAPGKTISPTLRQSLADSKNAIAQADVAAREQEIGYIKQRAALQPGKTELPWLTEEYSKLPGASYAQGYGDLSEGANPQQLLNRIEARTQKQIQDRGSILPQDPLAKTANLIAQVKAGNVSPEASQALQQLLSDEMTVMGNLGSMQLAQKLSPEVAQQVSQMQQDQIAVLSQKRQNFAAGVENMVPHADFARIESGVKQLANDRSTAARLMGMLRGISDDGKVGDPSGLMPRAPHKLIEDFYGAKQQLAYVADEMSKSSEAIFSGIKENLDPKLRESFYQDLGDAMEQPQKYTKFFEKYGDEGRKAFAANRYIQDIVERMREASPECLDLSRQIYVHHASPELRSLQRFSRNPDRDITQSSSIAMEEMRKYQTMQERRDAYAAAKAKLDTFGTENPVTPEDFYKLTPPNRAKLLNNMDEAQWRNLRTDDQKRLIDGSDKFLGQLLARPETDPAKLHEAQIKSLLSAIPLRRLFSNAQLAAVDLGDGQVGRLLEQGGKSGFYGLVDGQPYRKLSEIPQLANLKLVEPGPNQGELQSSSDFIVHPEFFKVLQNYFEASRKPTLWNRTMTAFKLNQVLGGILPHLMNTSTTSVLEYSANPMRMAGLSQAGRLLRNKFDEAGDLSFVGNALRAGVNPRVLESSVKAISESVIQAMGTDLSNDAMGVERNTLGKLFQAADPTDSGHQAALKEFNDKGGLHSLVANALSTPGALEEITAKKGMYKMIQNMQIAGYYTRAVDLFQSDPNLAKIGDVSQRWSEAQSLAAQFTNRAAGALPFWMFESGTRNAAYNTLMSPGWLMSRASAVVDALPFFSNSKWGGTGRFAHLAPEAQAALRGRLQKQVAVGLGASVAGTMAMSYMMTGQAPWSNPDPSTWLKIPVNGVYINGPVYGLVRDIYKFGTEMMKSAPPNPGHPWEATGPGNAGSVAWSLAHGDAKEAALKGLLDTISPAWRELASVVFEDPNAQRERGTDPDATNFMKGIDLVSHAAMGALLPDPELAGFKGSRFDPKKLVMPPTGDRGGEFDAMRLTPGAYLGQLLGIYESNLVGPKDLRGEAQAAYKTLTDTAKGRVTRYLDAAAAAADEGTRFKLRQMAYDAMSKGVPVPDHLKAVFGADTFRLNPKEWEGIVNRYYHPGMSAMLGLQPSGRTATLYGTLRDELLQQQQYQIHSGQDDYSR